MRRDQEKNCRTPTFIVRILRFPGATALSDSRYASLLGSLNTRRTSWTPASKNAWICFRHASGSADDRHRVDHLVGDEPRRLVAVPPLERLADPVGIGAEADAVHVLVVEDAHAADVERDVGPLAVARRRDVAVT